MNYAWIDDIDEFQKISREWDEALLASGEDNPFLLSGFISVWWKYYSMDAKLRIFVLYENGKICAGMPLYQDKSGYLRYCGGAHAAYTEFLSLPARNQPWEELFLGFKSIGSARCLLIPRFRKNRLDRSGLDSLCAKEKDLIFDIYRSTYSYLVDVPGDLVDYLNNLPKKLRYYLRRSEKELSRLDKLSLSTLSDRDDLDEWCDKYIELSYDSFRRRSRVSIFEDKRCVSFFKDLVAMFRKRGYLSAHILKLDTKVIAIHFGYSLKDNLNYLFPAFDMDLAQFNPGHSLFYKLLEFAVQTKKDLIDMCTGWRLYKEQWATRKEEVMSIEIRKKSLRNNIERLISLKMAQSPLLARFKELVHSSPYLERALKWMTARSGVKNL